jgi:hypothetical protein
MHDRGREVETAKFGFSASKTHLKRMKEGGQFYTKRRWKERLEQEEGGQWAY